MIVLAKLSLKIRGTNGLKNKLNLIAKKDEVKRIVRTNAVELQKGIVRNANFTKGFSTGATKRSVSTNLTFADDGFTAKTGPTTEYAGYVEKGTRKMSAQPFVLPAVKAQKEKFRQDLEELVK
ncbi:HK97-gp10 family putative phage morphogenesis protein [Streptococcus hillyeri]|uniref:HK97-gp10 family putative phage morphogenesis protein n=1 Tax=Streptococcus hillyeri TaxID=2282420 RepID=UPI0034E1C30C